jgi:hypothetical protein
MFTFIHQIWVVHHHPRHLDEDDDELGSPWEYALAFKYEHIRSITADGDDDEDDDELGSPWEYVHMWEQGHVLFMTGSLVNLCMVYVRE